MKIENFSLVMGPMLLLLMGCADDVSVLIENLRVDNLAIVQDATVINAIPGEEVGIAKLIREANEITMNYEAIDLIPGHAYTVW